MDALPCRPEGLTLMRENQATQELERALEGKKAACVKGPLSSLKEILRRR